LLPSFKNGITVSDDFPVSFFDPDIWQIGVFQSLEEFIRLKGLPTESRKEEARQLLTALLNQAKLHREKTDGFNLQNAGLDSTRWLAVVGIGAETRVEIKVSKIGKSPNFDLESDDRKNLWEKDNSSRLTGDGTVPYEGAIPKFLKEEDLVCVTPDDYGYWEIQDRLVSKVAGFHGILPNMDMLHRLIVRFFKDKPDPKENTWGRPAPGVKDENWNPPLKLRNKNR
jgi:hypothetical protein